MIFFVLALMIPVFYLWFTYPKCAENREYKGNKDFVIVRNPVNPMDAGHHIASTNRVDYDLTKWSAFIGGVYNSSFFWRWLFYFFVFNENDQYYYNRIDGKRKSIIS